MPGLRNRASLNNMRRNAECQHDVSLALVESLCIANDRRRDLSLTRTRARLKSDCLEVEREEVGWLADTAVCVWLGPEGRDFTAKARR